MLLVPQSQGVHRVWNQRVVLDKGQVELLVHTHQVLVVLERQELQDAAFDLGGEDQLEGAAPGSGERFLIHEVRPLEVVYEVELLLGLG